MRFRRHGVFAVLLAFLAATDSSAALFTIAKPQFGARVDPANGYAVSSPAQGGKISRAELTSNLLYFSVTIVGDQSTLEYLEEHRHLGLTVVIWADGMKRDSIEIGITPRDWERDQQTLKEELASMGVFTWRTFMNTKRIRHSRLVLLLLDDNDDTVGPPGHAGSYQATVRLVS